MPKLQNVIDAAFASVATEPVHRQQPSAAFLERERAFIERAHKIEALRRARMANPDTTLPALVFEVVRHRGHWRVLHRHRHSTPFANQAAAISAARERAREKRSLGHAVEVYLRRTDGKVIAQPIDD